jgi:uncharacterized membrane protein
VVVPLVSTGSGAFKPLLTGVMLGLFAYGTYDLTNQATLKNWPTIVTIVDLIWGALLTGVVSAISFSITRRWA